MSVESVVGAPGARLAQTMSSVADGHALKSVVVTSSLAAVGAAFELVSRWCPELQAELADWDDGLIFVMGVLPAGPYMAVKNEGGRVRYLGLRDVPDAGIKILFKSLDDAVLSFTAQLGTHTAVIQRRFVVHGNVADGMRISRALNIVQTYVLPIALLRKVYKRPPVMTPAKMWIKARVMAGLGPLLVTHAVRSE
ncbi:MAG: hypothetical protein IT350_17155 [Deltaproteobacteria bacterium]|nr:hypothetical protein [Deltaproteobacteria bacterium]